MADEPTHTVSSWRWRSVLDTTATIAFILACGSVACAVLVGPNHRRAAADAAPTQKVRRPDPPPPTEPVSLEGAAILGDRSARIVLIQYADFQCPYCARFARETLPALEAKYVCTGRLLVAFRHLPLPNHPFALKAGQASECAGNQGKFWQMHDLLFKDPSQLDDASLRSHARTLRLDGNRFDDCLAGRMEEKVRTDALQARSLRVSSTPTFFIGALQADGRVKVVQRLSGAQPAAAFESAIASITADATTSPEPTTGSSK